MTYGGNPHNPHDPFGGAPFGQFPGGQPPVQPPYGGPPIVSAPPPAPAKVNTFATLSVVFAFVFAPVGAVLGHLGLSQIKRTGERGRDRALIGTILSYVFTVAAVIGLVLWAVFPLGSQTPSAESSSVSTTTARTTTTTTKAGPGPVVPAQLSSLLLSIDDIKRVANAPNNYRVDDATTISGAEGLSVTPAGCITALFGGGTEVYAQSGMVSTLARTLSLVEPLKGIGMGGMEERVTVFQNGSDASRVADDILGVWRRCAGPVTLVFSDGTPTTHYRVGRDSRSARNPLIMMVGSTMDSSPTFANTRVVAAKANVVVDMHVFGGNLGDSAEAIAAEILARVPG